MRTGNFEPTISTPPLAVVVSSFSGLSLKINVQKMSKITPGNRIVLTEDCSMDTDPVQPAPKVCLTVPLPDEDYRLIPFFRAVGSLMEWSAGLISDRDVCKALRKAANEVQRGGF
jgi:hypothetical protein